MKRVSYTTVAVPLRISFSGGGTDLPSFYKQRMGAVLSTGIDKYIYVTVKKQGKLFGFSYRLPLPSILPPSLIYLPAAD